MKKITLIMAGLLFAVSAFAVYVIERDYNGKITSNTVTIPPDIVTTLNLRTNHYKWTMVNDSALTVFIGGDTVTYNKGIPVYPSSNATELGDATIKGWSRDTVDVQIWENYE